MTEEERIREEIAIRMYYERHPLGHWDGTSLRNKTIARKSADYILAIKGIRIEADDKSLPECRIIEQIDFDKHTFKYRDQPLQGYCPLLKANFIRVIPYHKER